MALNYALWDKREGACFYIFLSPVPNLAKEGIPEKENFLKLSLSSYLTVHVRHASAADSLVFFFVISLST